MISVSALSYRRVE